jgi:hypothetical protein
MGPARLDLFETWSRAIDCVGPKESCIRIVRGVSLPLSELISASEGAL